MRTRILAAALALLAAGCSSGVSMSVWFKASERSEPDDLRRHLADQNWDRALVIVETIQNSDELFPLSLGG
jgi:hypothetical protein